MKSISLFTVTLPGRKVRTSAITKGRAVDAVLAVEPMPRRCVVSVSRERVLHLCQKTADRISR